MPTSTPGLPTKKISFNFFKITHNNNSEHININERFYATDPNFLLRRGDGAVVKYDVQFRRNNGVLIGALNYIKTVGLSQQAEVETGRIESLNLPTENGLSNPVCFIFDSVAGLLMLQSNAIGLGVSVWCSFFEAAFSTFRLSHTYAATPVELNLINNMTRVRKFKFKIASRSESFGSILNGTTFESDAARADEIGANTIVVESSVRYAKPGEQLDKQTVFNQALELLGFRERQELEVLNVSVSGTTENEDDEEITLPTINFISPKDRPFVVIETTREVSAIVVNRILDEMYNLYISNYLENMRELYNE